MTKRRSCPGIATGSLLALALSLAAGPAQALPFGKPVFKWERCHDIWCQTIWNSSPAAGDVDGDGQVEVLGGGYTLMAVNGSSGGLDWTYPWPQSARMWPGPVVADLDGNGSLEIVVANSRSEVLVLNGSGAAWSEDWPVLPFGSHDGEIRSLAAADLDGDGAMEILVGLAYFVSNEQWTVLQLDGTTRAGWPQLEEASSGHASGAWNQNLTAGDLDSDLEVVATSDIHFMAVFEDDGSEVAAHPMFGEDKVWSQVPINADQAADVRGWTLCSPGDPLEARSNLGTAAPVVADLDGDGTREIVVVANLYDCRVQPYVDLYQMPFVFNRDRTRWSAGGRDWTVLPSPDGAAAPLSLDYQVIEPVMANPAVADLDGDGEKEILFPSYDGRMHAFWLDKTEKHGWPLDLNVEKSFISFASEPVVVDLDADGQAEVIFTTWTEKGSDVAGEIRIVSSTGAPIYSVPLPIDTENDTWGGALAAPTVDNIDADPELELLVATFRHGLLAYDLPGSAGAKILWGTGRGGYQRVPEPSRALLGFVAIVVIGITRRVRGVEGKDRSEP